MTSGPSLLSRERVSVIAHGIHPIACPLSDSAVHALIGQLDLRPGSRPLDAGCGPGEWLRRVYAAYPGCKLVGVDLSQAAIDQARAQSEGTGIVFELGDAAAAADRAGPTFDAVLCNGSAHIFGGWEQMIAALSTAVRPGGRMILSDGFWQARPSPELVDLFREQADLATPRAAAEAAGFQVIDQYVSSLGERDDYEDAWSSALEQFAAGEGAGSDEDRMRLRQIAGEHRDQYWNGYRGVLGYVALVLAS